MFDRVSARRGLVPKKKKKKAKQLWTKSKVGQYEQPEVKDSVFNCCRQQCFKHFSADTVNGLRERVWSDDRESDVVREMVQDLQKTELKIPTTSKNRHTVMHRYVCLIYIQLVMVM